MSQQGSGWSLQGQSGLNHASSGAMSHPDVQPQWQPSQNQVRVSKRLRWSDYFLSISREGNDGVGDASICRSVGSDRDGQCLEYREPCRLSRHVRGEPGGQR